MFIDGTSLPQGTLTPSLQVRCSGSLVIFLPTPFTPIFFPSKPWASCCRNKTRASAFAHSEDSGSANWQCRSSTSAPGVPVTSVISFPREATARTKYPSGRSTAVKQYRAASAAASEQTMALPNCKYQHQVIQHSTQSFDQEWIASVVSCLPCTLAQEGDKQQAGILYADA